MAYIIDVSLGGLDEVGRHATCTANINVLWERGDVGRAFILSAYLIEQDGRLDSYTVNANGSYTRRTRGTRDDEIGRIERRTITPTAEGRETYNLSRAWDWPSAHEYRNEYRSVATLVAADYVGQIRISSIVRSTVD